MNYRKLGAAGLKVSELSFGSWVNFGNQVDLQKAVDLLSAAYEMGINFFDNAEVYAHGESERIMGLAFKKMGISRDTFIVSSKVFWGGERPTQIGLSRKHMVDACHAALKRLQVDYLDLYFCHRPDPETPTLEIVQTMSNLIQQGKVLYWGTSEWEAERIGEAYHIAKEYRLIAPTMEQPEYNMVHRTRFEKEYAPLFKQYHMGSTIWSPLAGGILTGKYRDGIPQDSRMGREGSEWLRKRLESESGRTRIEAAIKLEPLAKQCGVLLSQFAIAWCLKNPNVSTVILGASKLSQLEENIKSIDFVHKLTPDIMKEVEKALGGVIE